MPHRRAASAAGRPRRVRTTHPRVVWIDRLTGAAIRIGGLAVVLSVLGMFAYLAAVVWPLVRPSRIDVVSRFALVEPSRGEDVIYAGLDEYLAAGIYLLRGGEVASFAARDGRVLGSARLWPAQPALTASRVRGGKVAVGFADGTVRLGELGFRRRFLDQAERAALTPPLAPGEVRVSAGRILEAAGSAEVRSTEPYWKLDDPLPLAPGEGAAPDPPSLLDLGMAGLTKRLAVLKSGGGLAVIDLEERENLLSGATELDAVARPVELPAELASLGKPAFLRLFAENRELLVAWPRGPLAAFRLGDGGAPTLVERADLAPGPGSALTEVGLLLGGQTLLVGDAAGEVSGWFQALRDGDPDLGQGRGVATAGFGGGVDLRGPLHDSARRLVAAHRYRREPAAVTAIAPSPRDRSFVVAGADGTVSVHHATTERLLARARVSEGPIHAVRVAPRGDAVLAVDRHGQAAVLSLHNPHPEVSVGSLLGKVWYEGLPRPSFSWQSSSGTDDFEPKLSLIPLIAGTLKATLYSMLLAVPIGLLAAVYTSEFLDRGMRARLKPVVELMATLPSVVLGFVAALVMAPVVESWVLAVLLVFGLVPLVLLGLGYLWQMLPSRVVARLSGAPVLGLTILAVVAAVLAARELAGGVEGWLFAGDFKAWLDGRAGTGAPGVAALAWPFVLGGLLLLDRAFLVPVLTLRLRHRPRLQTGLVELGKYLALAALSLAVAAALGVMASGLGMDPRGGLLGTYVQRNALVVGLAMGFAVIPILYTIAEDSLSAVPESLRSASLACGATRWQTAMRVILPVAAPGVFSALMVSLGRAVGETMIVLMAAGNTPILDWNVFNGLRTLSANIAVELPEAARGGTLYRILFLSALTLFAMTLVVNTAAELLRQRVRQRSAAL